MYAIHKQQKGWGYMQLNRLNEGIKSNDWEKNVDIKKSKDKLKWKISIKTENRSMTIVKLLCGFSKCYVQGNNNGNSNEVIAYVETEAIDYIDMKLMELNKIDYINEVNVIAVIGLTKLDKIKMF